MSDKQLTPIQTAIQKLKGSKFTKEGNLYQQHYNMAIEEAIYELESLLPAEKEFAKDMWDSGVKNYRLENATGSKKIFYDPAPDFDEIYKQYEP